ncbi:hypothetical protein F5148DRAFT_632993 [Russula earlei]|uniref:Uncharacterized protein n=1 Tax=Russula earlei TaxID=71964 RepID=A0ACC0TVC5_9AGAM|nr:hypothetical protein F5148DRAFT_632993 [Russula earlei]
MLTFAALLRRMRKAHVSQIRCATRRRLPRRSLTFFSGPIPAGAAEEPPLALVRSVTRPFCRLGPVNPLQGADYRIASLPFSPVRDVLPSFRPEPRAGSTCHVDRRNGLTRPAVTGAPHTWARDGRALRTGGLARAVLRGTALWVLVLRNGPPRAHGTAQDGSACARLYAHDAPFVGRVA